MILLVDIGNSRIKWTQQDNDNISGYYGDYYDRSNLAASLDQLWGELTLPEEMWVANVAGKEVGDQLVQWCKQLWHITPRFVQVTKRAFGVTNSYTNVSSLGIDRWLTMLAAWNKYHSAVFIADCGTAVTIDALDREGRHLGGLILPGITLMLQSIQRATSAISEIKDVQVTAGLANNTEQAVATGCTMAIVAVIERALQDIQHGYNEEFKYVITGGGAEKITGLLANKFVHEPHLVLEGLTLYAGENS